MNLTLKLATSVAVTLASSAALAGADSSCHFHGNKPAAEATVLTCAGQYKDKLVEGGKIDASWKTVAKPEKVEQVDGKRAKEWRISFRNPAVADQAKQSLYLFYSLPGNFIAANHTGQ
jgi:hypothetical protein